MKAKAHHSMHSAASSPIRLPLVALSAFLVSAAALGYEVALTSIFAVALQYHAVHLAVAVGISGMGAGALVIGRVVQRRAEVHSLLPVMAALAAVAMGLTTWVAFRLDPGSSQFALPALAFVPFSLLGAALAIALRAAPQDVPWIYAADLAGGALGAAGVMLLLDRWGGPQAALTLAALPALAAVLMTLGAKAKLEGRVLAAVSLMAALVLPVVNSLTGVADFRFNQMEDPSGDKTMLQMIHHQQGKVVATRWNAFGRTDLVETPDDSHKYIFINGGAGAPMIKFDGDLSKVAGLNEYMEFLPFAAINPERVLVVGAGGGVDVLMALVSGATEVTAVEINPGALELVREYRDYNGGIFDHPSVKWVAGDARNFVSRDTSKYDLILLNLVFTQAAEARSYSLSENYIFTLQAFKQYLDRLTPGGAVAVITHNPLEATRAYFTGLKALDDRGFQGAAAAHRTALWFWPDGPIEDKRSVVLIRGSEFSKAEAESLRQMGTGFGLKPMYIPHVEEFMLAPLITGKTTVDKMVAQGDYNFWPTTDDRPFFYNLEKSLPPAAGLLLVLAGAGLFLLTVLATALADKTPSQGRFWTLYGYFILIGVGYMLVQVPMIQGSILLLGSPTLAIAAILVTMLLGGAAGSAMSQQFVVPGSSGRTLLLGLIVAGVALLYLPALPVVTGLLLPLTLSMRTFLFSLFLLPLAFVMGMPFPTGLRYAGGDGRTADIPLFYGLNGAASVLGSALAMAVAISYGYTVVMLAGAALYALLPLAAWRLRLE